MPAITFSPAHPQPFTLEQAMLLEINILVTEIQRLENSIRHLRDTQAQLAECLADEEDQELRLAYDENEGVIASQSERITLIKVALLNKVGQESAAHYGIAGTSARPGGDTDPHRRSGGGGGGIGGIGGVGGGHDGGVGDGALSSGQNGTHASSEQAIAPVEDLDVQQQSGENDNEPEPGLYL